MLTVYITLLLGYGIATVFANYGILLAEQNDDSTKSVSACILYNPTFKSLPKTQQDTVPYGIADYSNKTGCNDTGLNSPAVNGNIVLLRRGNCSFSEKALYVQEEGGVGLVIVNTPHTDMTAPGINDSFTEANITVAMISEEDFQRLKALGLKNVKVWLFAPDPPKTDYNMIVIWLIAVMCIIIGANWAGTITYSNFLRKRPHLIRPGEEKMVDSDPKPEDLDSVNLSAKHLIILVVVMCAVIIALYYLYDYLVYVIISAFCIAGSMSLYNCVWPWIQDWPPVTRLPANRIPLLSDQPQVKSLIVLAMCCGVGIFWAIERNSSYAWILQDVMGVTFCIYLMATIRLRSLKMCTILLVLLFFYDIFFVFVTKLFTKSGESVMVEVATGGSSSSGEQLPMVFKVPRFSISITTICDRQFSLLGFGDVLIPGLLVSFGHGFDRKVRSPRVYFICGVVAYGVGLVITFVALALMETGQPALLYLVPCTVLTTIGVALKRGELKMMWAGEPDLGKTNGDVPGSARQPSYQTPPTVPDLDTPGEEGPLLEPDERQLLINRSTDSAN